MKMSVVAKTQNSQTVLNDTNFISYIVSTFLQTHILACTLLAQLLSRN